MRKEDKLTAFEKLSDVAIDLDHRNANNETSVKTFSAKNTGLPALSKT